MGETSAGCARDGLSRLKVELLIPGAATFGIFGVTGVPLDEDILPMYHDYNQNGEGYEGAQPYHQLVNMNITFLSMNSPEPNHDRRRSPSQPTKKNKQITRPPEGNIRTYDQWL